jgi:hypothetical protein
MSSCRRILAAGMACISMSLLAQHVEPIKEQYDHITHKHELDPIRVWSIISWRTRVRILGILIYMASKWIHIERISAHV